MPPLRYVLLGLLALGCGDNGVAADEGTCTEVRKQIPVAVNRNLDILFVIDDSPSMADEAVLLEENLRTLAAVLENIEGGLPNLHIGVVSSTGSGELLSDAQIDGCSPPDGEFIRDIVYANGEREKNYAGELADVLACVGSLAPTESSIEQPLLATQLALQNDDTGFLRDDAFLQIVIFGDEDDCSGGESFVDTEGEANTAWRCLADSVECDEALDAAGIKTNCEALPTPMTLTPLTAYRDALQALKPDPSLIVLSVLTSDAGVEVQDTVSGPALASACPDRSARPMPRLDAFRSLFPNRNDTADVCESDWSETLLTLASPLQTTLQAHCIADTIDLDPDQSGVQHECVVSQTSLPGTDSQEEVLIPECQTPDGEGETPCWRLEEGSQSCQAPDSIGFEVLRGRESISGATLDVRCHAGCTN